MHKGFSIENSSWYSTFTVKFYSIFYHLQVSLCFNHISSYAINIGIIISAINFPLVDVVRGLPMVSFSQKLNNNRTEIKRDRMVCKALEIYLGNIAQNIPGHLITEDKMSL